MRARPLVLNVDDNEAGRYAVSRNLKQSGYDVEDAGSGAEALRMTQMLRPDVVLLDVRLPDIDGFEVCRRIREGVEIAGTPIIQLSASYLDTRSRIMGLESGADAYLTEPVEPAVLVATIRSLLRIRSAEQSVRRSVAEWQITFNAIRDGVALLDANGVIIRHNAAFERTAAPAAQGIKEAIDSGLNLLRSGARHHTEEVVAADNTFFLTLDPISAGDDFEGAVCVVADITEKKRFEAELRQAARLESMGVLAGGIAHDFNNLLTGIMGNSTLLLESLPDGTFEWKLVKNIVQASESAAHLTRQILAYAGKGQFLKTSVNLTEIAHETGVFVRSFIPQHVELIYDTDPDLPPIQADASQMQQLVMNLVINAAESFGKSGRGVIIVRTAQERLDPNFFRNGEKDAPGSFVALAISDTGDGMDEDTKRRIFEPFFTTKFTGRGLGLSAVHGILTSHDGYLRMESQPGEGTTFRLYFPVGETNETSPSPAKPARFGKSQGTILFVDDEHVVRDFAVVALQDRGYHVLLAENGRAAVDLFQNLQDAISLVILDFTMPGMNGEKAFEKLRQISPAVPIILSSGFSETTAAEKFAGKGLAGFLGKPYTLTRLLDAVETVLSSPGTASPDNQEIPTA